MDTQHAVQIFRAAIAAVQPARLLREHLVLSNGTLFISGHRFPIASLGHIYVIGAGKAAAAMALETEKILGEYISEGLVTTKYDHSLPTIKIKVIEAAHPVPDDNCVKAVARTMDLLKKATSNDLVICLLSGGASALWCDVPPGITLPEIQYTFDRLINSGAAIDEINTVRKHLSSVKGGQLIRYCGGAAVVSLIISDVPGDHPGTIASGPTVADTSDFNDAYTILSKYDLLPLLPPAILQHIENGLKGIIKENPKPGDELFNKTVNSIIGSNQIALLAAAGNATALGYHTHIIPRLITGDTETAAADLIKVACQYNGSKPACILQGGETTLKVTGNGKGGRNQHFVLAALQALSKLDNDRSFNKITVLSGGTDGTDGPTDATGGVADDKTIALALEKGLSIESYLKDHDAYHFLKQTNSLIITGATQTNVMDIMLAIVQ